VSPGEVATGTDREDRSGPPPLPVESPVDIQPELLTLLIVAILGQSAFAVFEVETARWRKLLKWTLVVALTLGARPLIGHAAVAIPIVLGVAGVAFHVWWCRRNGIHALDATPRKRYYQLRGWRWVE
jgi:hypothetical protein